MELLAIIEKLRRQGNEEEWSVDDFADMVRREVKLKDDDDVGFGEI